jgi:hypothetical protein
MMVKAEDTRDLPDTFLILPEVNELRLANGLVVLMAGMVETVNADLDGAIVGNGIYLERPGNEFPSHFAADVVLDSFDSSLTRAAEAADVVIELQIVGQEGAEFLQIATVVSIEELGI